eukprot:1001253-Rhodomonas_salina.7
MRRYNHSTRQNLHLRPSSGVWESSCFCEGTGRIRRKFQFRCRGSALPYPRNPAKICQHEHYVAKQQCEL